MSVCEREIDRQAGRQMDRHRETHTQRSHSFLLHQVSLKEQTHLTSKAIRASTN